MPFQPVAEHAVLSRAPGADGAAERRRALPEEVPVAITVNGTTQAVLMATPADLEAFATGFALTEGLVVSTAEIGGVEIVEFPQGIEARLNIAEARAAALAARRRAMLGPVGCGLCGIESLEEALRRVPPVADGGPVLDAAEAMFAAAELDERQELRRQTGLTHAAGFLRPGAGIVAHAEDVGRHNALDKLVGRLALVGTDAAAGALVMTSRISIDLVQKAAMAGCPILIAASGPTAAAVRLAETAGITLMGFAGPRGVDCYAHPQRLRGAA